MQIKIIENLGEAEKLWKLFVSPDSWYNQWDLRKLFYEIKEIGQIRFYLATDGNQPIGLLPLQISKVDQKIEFFGGRFFEDNQVWAKDESTRKFLYKNVGGKIFLDSILPVDQDLDSRITLGDPKFVLPVHEHQTIEDYLQIFSKKRRGNLRRIFKKLAESDLQISYGKPANLELLFQLNIKRFGEESIFNDLKHASCFQEMIKLNNNWQITVFKLHGKIEAVSLGALYNKTYIYHNAGTNITDYPNLGNVVIYHNIKKAIDLGADNFDAGSEDLGWKSRWHLNAIPMCKLDT